MYLEKIQIKNFRLLKDVTINIDESSTLIVGKNNTGKTSFMGMLDKVINGHKLNFNDYPINSRKEIYKLLESYIKKEIAYDDFIKQISIPSIKFYISYSLENEDEFLGSLSPFIIDLDSSTTTAIIFAEYQVTILEKSLEAIIEDSLQTMAEPIVFSAIADNREKEEIIKEITKNNFTDMFTLSIKAINPTDGNDMQKKELNELKALFPLYIIRAERGLDESEVKNSNPLKSIITKVFAKNMENTSQNIEGEIEKLKLIVKEANKNVQKHTNDSLSLIVENAIKFGYPNAENLQLTANTEIAIENQIINETDLWYIEQDSLEKLPSTYSGLGYKNLIKIIFALTDFAKNIVDNVEISIPLLFLEEPESHMHPQLQQTFVKYLKDFLNEISKKAIQIFITTHSSHIVDTVEFKQVRYMQKKKSEVKCKDLNDFSSSDRDNADFIQKYLTLSKCDLFFADKAILIEGASERLFLPDMIKKCDKLDIFETDHPRLPSQYYALIEVGGAYAHKFCPFMEFLGIPTLIITDIDSIGTDSKKCLVSKGTTSSNATIKWWVKRANGLKDDEKITLDQIISLDENKKSEGNCHIEYQTQEEKLCGRSLEESIINVNRSIFGVKDNPEEADIKFDGKKTDFALKLMIENDSYTVPAYIKQGLIWLNKQKSIVK